MSIKSKQFLIYCREDRITVQEKERLAQKEKDQEYEQRKLAQDRRQETLRVSHAFIDIIIIIVYS